MALLGWILSGVSLLFVFEFAGTLLAPSPPEEDPVGASVAMLLGALALFALGWRMGRERRPVGPAIWISRLVNVPGFVAAMRSSRPPVRPPSSPTDPPRARAESRNAALGVAAGVAWLLSAIVAVRFEIRWFPPPSSLMFLAIGTCLATVAGAAGGALAGRWSRWQVVRLAPVGAALLVPLVAVAIVPPWGRLRTVPLPGRVDMATTARRDGPSDLYLVLAGGTSIVKLTETGTPTGGASLSPDGTRIAFGDDRRGTLDLWVMDLGPSHRPLAVRQLTDDPSDESFPVWSPDGRSLAYTETRSDGADVRIVDAATGRVAEVTDDGRSFTPSWSPHGAWIVYSSTDDAYASDVDLWEVRPDGSDAHLVLDSGGDDRDAHLSPDGRRIVFTSDRSGNDDVWVADVDGSNLRSLTPGQPATDRAFGWSPDGRYALFTSDRSDTGGTFLYFTPVTGGQATLGLVL